MIARRDRDPLDTPRWFVAMFALGLVVGLGFIGLIAWALVEVVRWLTSN